MEENFYEILVNNILTKLNNEEYLDKEKLKEYIIFEIETYLNNKIENIKVDIEHYNKFNNIKLNIKNL